MLGDGVLIGDGKALLGAIATPLTEFLILSKVSFETKRGKVWVFLNYL